MSPLQWGLIITGVLVLLAMLAHTVWLARRAQPRKAQESTVPATDAAGPREPTLDPQVFAETGFALPVPEKKPTMDALIDVIAPITLEAPVSGAVLLAALPPTRRVGSKPFTVEGFSELDQAWEFPLPAKRYNQVQAGIQLANRQGPLNDIEFSEFVVKAQTFCDCIGGNADFPDMRQEVNRARELDQFASDHDAQLSFVLRARRTAWSPSYIQQMAAKLGFVPGSMPGRLVISASQAGLPPLMSLTFDAQAALAEDPTQSALREVILSLDVAQVDRGERAFVRMREAALALASEMDGVVTDDNGVALPAEAMDVVESELEVLYDTLAQRDLAAGSVLARRLFS